MNFSKWNLPNLKKTDLNTKAGRKLAYTCLKIFLLLLLVGAVLGTAAGFGALKGLIATAPDISNLSVTPSESATYIYNSDGSVMQKLSLGSSNRTIVTIDQIPEDLQHAVVAIEDERFYQHKGIDIRGILRAGIHGLASGRFDEGASTITQQLARNFFLSPEKTLMRKIKEAFLAIRIEQLLNKDEILELYLNKIYLGYRAYGVGAAAQVYFGKPIDQLTLSEMAVIAGLPKAPSTFNPLYSMDRATARRNVVLSRMLSEGYITQAQYDEARSEPIDASYHAPKIAFSAPYLSEMVRQEMVNRYGEQAYEDGYRVYTTITRKNQQAAQQAVRNNVLDYDMRHGYRGPASVL